MEGHTVPLIDGWAQRTQKAIVEMDKSDETATRLGKPS